MASFELHIPTNLSFQDYIAVTQTARAWADGYDLKSYPHLISALAPQVTVDYTRVNPAWGSKVYNNEEFAKLWLSDEHLGNVALKTQHLLSTPYFQYVGPRRSESVAASEGSTQPRDIEPVEEVQLTWQVLASHGRLAKANDGLDSAAFSSTIEETSDHRAFMTHIWIKIDTPGEANGSRRRWRLALIKPEPIYMQGDFGRVRRPASEP